MSGSVNECLPEILGILMNLKGEISTIFQFSNDVVETSFEALLSGKIQTTGGTDFNCMATSIIEKGFDRAIVFTDGYASLDRELGRRLHEKEVMLLSVLFGDSRGCEQLAAFGDVVRLEDAVE